MYSFNGRYQKPKILGLPQWTAIGWLIVVMGSAFGFMLIQLSVYMLVFAVLCVGFGIYLIATGKRRMNEHYVRLAIFDGNEHKRYTSLGIDKEH